MILKPSETTHFDNLHGGTGSVIIEKTLQPGTVDGLDLFAKVTVEIGANIGYHEHIDDSEGYYILSGEAEFMDSDQSVRKAWPGDLCLIVKGESHGIVNIGKEPLIFLAVVF
ncbi:cupin domain-containing protein [Salinicoccus siamensis]|uniref:Cupin domain-containing protein n=1 Tax=Salinicoccus siamensis TaxID=381830 RepID=A0ABV5Z3R5_9STAP